MELAFADKILCFTDGACSGNPGPGGFGAVIVYPEGHVVELGERRAETTNNRMEMLAVIRVLEELQESSGDVWIYTDSTYVIRGITQWIWAWKKRDWETAGGKEVSNKDLWQQLDRLVYSRKKQDLGKIEWHYVRGHTGNPGNERCDVIAVSFSGKKKVDLYSGKLLGYAIPVHDLPESSELPPMKSKGESGGSKKKPLSYLSYVNGELKRHKSWKECEGCVKNRSGAKFKKAMSTSDERSIVKAWGLDPNLLDNLR